MTHQKTVKEINNKLSELTHSFEKLSSSNEIHLIDVDILLGIMRELYVKTSLLKEPVNTEEILAIPAPKPFAPPTNQPFKPGNHPNFPMPSTPLITTPVASHEETPEAEQIKKADPIHNTPDVPQVSHLEEHTQPEIRRPEVEIAQRQPEVVHPQPEIIIQKSEIVQPKSEYPPQEPKESQPPMPEVVEPPVAPPPSYYSPKPAAHQADLFGNGSLSDKYKTEAPSINDKINTGKPDQTLADKMNLVPITDIKSAIGINEKFQFINELFDGSSQDYNETIALLNNCNGADAAHALFHDFQTRYKWDTENKAFLKFREYMERRYLHS